MKTKCDKNNKKTNLIPRYVKVMIVMVIITFCGFLIYKSFSSQVTYASTKVSEENVEKEYKAMENDIDLQQIIKSNENTRQEKIEIEEIDLEYTTIYENSNELPKGTMQVLQEGKNGMQQAIYQKFYENGELVKEEQIGTKLIKTSIDKIVQVGTASYTSTYKVKVGDEMYVTSNTLDVKKEALSDSDKVIVLNKNDKVIVQVIRDEWYYIAYGNYTGWLKKECLTYKNPNVNTENQTTSGQSQSKKTLLAKLSKDMKLNKPSGFSLEQFKKVLTNNEKDKNQIFKNNAEYFYYIEKQYNINGVFVAAVAIHESNWGTSKLATNKKNLFGYGAYDRDPYDSAYSFSSYSEGIDLLARVFMKYYLNPSETKIYGDEVATGRYYNGATLKGVNTRYATDKNWANAVYKWMEYLYNCL